MKRKTIKTAVLCCTLVFAAACSPNNDAGDVINPSPPAITDAPSATEAPEDFDGQDVAEDDENGYIGTVELEDGEHPLLLYDGLSYAVSVEDKTAAVVGSIFSDDTLDSYSIRGTIPYEGESYTVTSIGEDAFYCFMEAKSIAIPETVTHIGDSAFDSCEMLESIKLPDSLTYIGSNAFASCISLESCDIPDSVAEVGESLFYDCENLKSVRLPRSLKSIPAEMFSGCSSLETLDIPETVTAIGMEAFWYCEALDGITLPEGLAVIEDRAFYDCMSLGSLTFPESLIAVSDDIFDYCDSLTTLKVPKDKVEYYSGLFAGYDIEVIAAE